MLCVLYYKKKIKEYLGRKMRYQMDICYLRKERKPEKKIEKRGSRDSFLIIVAL